MLAGPALEAELARRVKESGSTLVEAEERCRRPTAAGSRSGRTTPGGKRVERYVLAAAGTRPRLYVVGVEEWLDPDGPSRPRSHDAVPHQLTDAGKRISSPPTRSADGRRPLVPRRAAVHLHPVRRLLHTGAPGFVWVTDDDLAALAAFLLLPVAEVTAVYSRRACAAAAASARRPAATASSSNAAWLPSTRPGRRSAAPGRSGTATSTPPTTGDAPSAVAPAPDRANSSPPKKSPTNAQKSGCEYTFRPRLLFPPTHPPGRGNMSRRRRDFRSDDTRVPPRRNPFASRRFRMPRLLLAVAAVALVAADPARRRRRSTSPTAASTHAPENTLANFDACLPPPRHRTRRPPHRRRSPRRRPRRHGEPHHHRHGKVSALSLAALQALDAGAWFDPAFAGERVPTLDAVFARVAARKAGTMLAIDLKEVLN